MNFSQLEVLAAVAQTGSFTVAAEQIGLTQSAASHALANLEAELGVTLLERGRGGVALTEIGSRVLAHANEILTCAESIRQESAAARGLAVGKLRIGSFPSISGRLLTGIIHDFKQCHPGIELVLFEGIESEVADWIRSGAVDTGFITLPVDGLSTTLIAQDEFRLVVPAHHPLSQQPAVQMEQIADAPFILSKAGCEVLIRGVFQSAHMPMRSQFEASDIGTILAMVQEGLGVSLVPELNLPESLDGVRALPLNPPAYRQLALGLRMSAAVSPAVTAFIHQAQTWAQTHDFG